MLDGLASFLRGAKCLFDHRDHLARRHAAFFQAPPDAAASWHSRLAEGAKLDENDAMVLLRDFQLPANAGRVVENEADALAAARDLGGCSSTAPSPRTSCYPVVLKTAVTGIDHKSDRGGVHLGIEDETGLKTAYQDLAKRIGARVLVAPMVRAQGVEMLLGMIHDEQFGPVVILGFGGVHVEALADVVYALPPFDAAEARRLVGRLKLAPLLHSPRHKRPLAIDEFCATAARFSSLVAALGDSLSEMDLNPVIVNADGCVIVDALVVGRRSAAQKHDTPRHTTLERQAS